MIELFFITCLATAPQSCQERSIIGPEDGTLMACMMAGQPQMAQWSEQHPGHKVKRWSCRMVNTAEVKI